MDNFAFTVDEYKRRISRLKQKMSEANVQALIIDQFEHLAYFTGYLPTAAMYQACLLPLAGEPIPIVRALDEPMFVEQSWIRTYVTFADIEDPIQVLANAIKQQKLETARIATEKDSHFLLVARFEQLQLALPQSTMVDFSRHMWELRLYKSPREIEYLKTCASICDGAFAAALGAVSEGAGERDIVAQVYAAAIRGGADNTRLLLMAAGTRAENMHAELGNRTLEAGDVIRVELVPHYKRYTARMIRPIVVGDPDPKLAGIAQRLIEVQDLQYALMKPGARARDVDQALRNRILKEGLRSDYKTISGYTLGLGSIPRTSDFTRVFLPNSDWILEENMVFHMYTSVDGIWFSDTILITSAGSARLTGTERRLFSR